MSKKTVSGVMLVLLVSSMLTLVCNIQPVCASGTIYIRADGSIDPSAAPIYTSDNITYTLIGNITADADGIVIERDNVVLDGAGYTVTGSGSGNGIALTNMSNVTVRNMTITKFLYGIDLSYSSNHVLSGNNVTNNGYGIKLDYSSNNTLSGNKVTNNTIGIWLYSSSSNVLSGNMMVGNRCNFFVFGSVLSDFLQSVDTSNVADGKPVYYFVNQSDLAVNPSAFPEVGYLGFVNCANVTVEGLNLTSNGQGILVAFTNDSEITGNYVANNEFGIMLGYSSNNTLSGNNAANNVNGIYLWASFNIALSGNNATANNSYGIYLYSSSDNTLSGNNVMATTFYGIELSYSSDNTLSGNNAANNNVGISIDSSSNNVLSGNNVTDNGNGIELEPSSSNNVLSGNNVTANSWNGIDLESSSNNFIFHNSFVGNKNQAYKDGSANIWDDGYPSGGNYWSDYNGLDQKCGPSQDHPGSDGIGDTPYIIGSNNTDNYPLMNPWSARAKDRLGLGADFLEQLYNSSIGLCQETFVGESSIIIASNGTLYQFYTNETYWIASDNYLESIALTSYNLTLSGQINQTCRTFYNGSYYPYQILQGMSIPLTLHTHNTYVLENTSDYIIALNLYNGTPRFDDNTTLDYPKYGDTLVYQALNYYVLGYPLNWCNNLYMEAYNMFDGKGVADVHFQNTSQYDNMKLALLIFGARILNLNVNLTGIEQQLWSAQNMTLPERGGIISVMNSSGQPVGTANGETTALTLLAYDDNLVSQIQSERNKPTKESLDETFPATNFNQTISATTNLTAIPLPSNWAVTSNNTVQWTTSLNNPRVALGFCSSLADHGNLSIQIVEYDNKLLDIVIHNATSPDGLKIPANLNWSNPLKISLISGWLNISSPAGTFDYPFPSFRLAYITAGSTPLIANTNESGICVGGEVNISVSAPHDVAFANVTSSKTVVGQGFSASVNVTVANQGGYPETFNATAYANTTIIASQNVTLPASNSTAVTFTWNTTGFAMGNYSISAYAWPVPSETYMTDNNCTGGCIIVSLVGDITGPNGWPDGTVDRQDVGFVASHFGQTVPFAPSNCDLTGPTLGVPDGKVDITDVATVAKHFGDIIHSSLSSIT